MADAAAAGDEGGAPMDICLSYADPSTAFTTSRTALRLNGLRRNAAYIPFAVSEIVLSGSELMSYCGMLVTVGGQAASGCWLRAWMPSMNFTPVISFGNWL